MLQDLILKNRSYRRFYQNRRIDAEALRDLVNLARLSPSATNMQPLKYILAADTGMNARIFPNLAWAGYLTDWSGPEDGERPSAYIVILGDTELRKTGFDTDCGIAAQSILLGAVEKRLGGCMIGSINRESLREELGIPKKYEIVLVIALGYPKEKVVLEETDASGNIRYYRDAEGVHHVPKRPLDEIIPQSLKEGYE